MLPQSTHSTNFLRPSGQPLSPESPNRRKWWEWWIGVVSVCILVYSVYSVVSAHETGLEGVHNGRILTPQRWSIFQSVKNFLIAPVVDLQGEKEDRVNVLVLGIGGPGQDGPFLSDTNLILSLKPSTKEVAMISIPRDLGVNIEGFGWRKINSADAIGEAKSPGNGAEFSQKVFEKTFALTIPYYVRIDFKAFQEIIDEVGGVTINVPKSFLDTQFPGPNYSYRTVNFTQGVETMNGERALTFARSRHGNNGEGSDFARARRQQLVLVALKEKLLSAGTIANPVRIKKILTILSNHLVTNLSLEQMLYLGGMGKDINAVKHLVFDDSAGGYLVPGTGVAGAYILSPRTGNFNAINQAIANVFEKNGVIETAAVTPRAPTENIPALSSLSSNGVTTTTHGPIIEIQNGTWKAGLARRLESKLVEKGFEVGSVGNSQKRPFATTTIFVLNHALSPELFTGVRQIVKAEFTTEVPEWVEIISPSNQKPDVLILLGTDFSL